MTRPNLILMVDHNHRNLELLGQFLEKQGYETVQATTLEEFQGVLNSQDPVGVALVDISGFDRSIWQYCQQLSDKDVPFIVISPKQAAAIREESRSHGATDVLLKPLVVQELSSLIKNLIDGE